MTVNFPRVLRGLMRNRQPSPSPPSRRSANSKGAIDQLLAGTLLPTPQLLEEIAPILQIDLADLLVIAGMPKDCCNFTEREPYPSSTEITQLIAASTPLTPTQVNYLIGKADHFRNDIPDQQTRPLVDRDSQTNGDFPDHVKDPSYSMARPTGRSITKLVACATKKTNDFAKILRGLMHNRRLSARALSGVTARAQSTINQLLIGKLAPTAQHLRDIAPTLQMDLADLLVIADLPTDSKTIERKPYHASAEIGRLVALASLLTPRQIRQLAELAKGFKTRNQDDQNPRDKPTEKLPDSLDRCPGHVKSLFSQTTSQYSEPHFETMIT